MSDVVTRCTKRVMAEDPSRPLLRISGVKMRFGGVIALGGVSFDVGYGQICGLIGPNGSGKTTLFNCISGIYRYIEGDIQFEGQSLTNHAAPPDGRHRARPHLSERRAVSQHERARQHPGRRAQHGAFRLHRQRVASADRAREQDDADRRLHELLDLLDLRQVTDTPAGAIPFGWQKRVELARALMTRAETADARRTGGRPQSQ